MSANTKFHFLVVVLTFPGLLFAQGGTLDPLFAESGVLRATFGSDFNWFSDIDVTPDDHIVVAGFKGVYGSRDMLVCAYLPDGSPDPAFGSDGVAQFDLGGDAWARGLLYTPDGILVTGLWNNEFVLLRVTDQGELDPTFGNGGIATFETDAPWSSGYSICLTDDGILVLGAVTELFSVWRYRSDGSIDQEYGEAGCRTLWDYDYFHPGNIAALEDGSSISAGSRNLNGYMTAVLVKLDAGGDPDPAFGGTGVVDVDLGPYNDSFHGMQLLPDGKVVVAGFSGTSEVEGGEGQGVVGRFTTTGSPDPGFGTNGLTFFSNQGAVAKNLLDMACMSDGTIVAAGGIIYSYAPLNMDLLVVQLTEQGVLDACFGDGGEAITHLDSNAVCTTMTIQPDRKVLVAGRVNVTDTVGYDGLIARYVDCAVNIGNMPTSASVFSIVPDPVSAFAKVRFPVQAHVSSSLNVYDAMGRLALMKILSRSFAAGDWSDELDCTRLSPGLYTVELHIEERVFRDSFIKD